MRYHIFTLPVLLILWATAFPIWESSPGAEHEILVDNFERYEPGDIPYRWYELTSSRELVHFSAQNTSQNEQLSVTREGGRQFLRAYTRGEVIRAIMPFNESVEGRNWSLTTHPVVQWDWRALTLPANAREDQRSLNDVAAAVYVTFGTDWLGRPQSIKYTYSTTLPVGTELSQGSLRVIVASSGREGNSGSWKTIRRNVQEDYRRVFGSSPPSRPVSIMVWSDSDTISGASSRADFDNIKLRTAR